MNYIILDMEWNQPLYAKMTVTEPVVLHAEVVQIGAVKLDESFCVTDTFNIIISPKYYKKMHKKVQTLTGITNEELKNGTPFPEAFSLFRKWCGDDIVLLTWGPDDIPVLKDNMILHSIDTEYIPKNYNLQVIFDAQITKEHRQMSLSGALETLGETGEEAHNALHDAKNTAIVCRHLDMVSGLENYDELKAIFLTPFGEETDFCGGEYETKRAALRDSEVYEVECPDCQNKVNAHGFIRQNPCKTLGIAKCECGSELFVRLKFVRKEEKYRVKRAVLPMTDEFRAFYEEKKEISNSFKKRRHTPR
ncbi:MAG: hypothetical protein E7613_01760 [Ruminococcaceae bacterium]|nr:hypothetical protein [Oscillospiraceae bacterium]